MVNGIIAKFYFLIKGALLLNSITRIQFRTYTWHMHRQDDTSANAQKNDKLQDHVKLIDHLWVMEVQSEDHVVIHAG
jgi:hypothetical protein